VHLELGIRSEQAIALNFYAAERDILDAAKLAAERGGELLRTVVQSICAVDTGYMRDHVRLWLSASGLVFEVGWDATDFLGAGLAFYPFFVEYGTRYMAAQPALGPAWTYVQPIYAADVRELIAVAVARRNAA
jgi:hypothetical protein